MIVTDFLQTATRFGSSPFLVTEDETMTWEEAGLVVGQTSDWLVEQGVRPGDRVALLMGNDLIYFVLLLAVQHAGAITVPLSTRSTKERLEAVVTDSGVGLGLTGRGASDVRLDGTVNWIRIEGLTHLRTMVHGRGTCAVERSDDHDAFLIYTSGTTGKPKGVVLSEAAFPTAGRLLAEAIGVRQGDRIATALPLFHTNPIVYGLMVAISTGCSIAVLERFSPSTMLEQASRLGATGFTYVGTVLTLLGRHEPPPPGSSLRFAVGGGAPPEAWQRMEEWGIEVLELYGMTETGGWLTCSRRGTARRGHCGTVRPDSEIMIVDASGQECAPETIGEIVARPQIRSCMVTRYEGLPDLAAQRWRGGWLHTGDRGTLSADGYLRYVDRLDGIIRRAGENIDPQDVVDVVQELSAVHVAAVVGVPDDIVGNELRLVVVGPEVTVQEIAQHVEARLPREAWPRFVAVTDALPLTDTQKIDLGALRTRGAEDVDLQQHYRRVGATR